MADKVGSQKEKAPGFGEESGMGDLLSTGLRYGIPLAYLGASQRQIKKLRGKVDPNLQSPDLMTGTVRDMPRPNFALPANPETGGSSLSEFMNNGLARDAFQRDHELDFQMKNAINRQAQEDRIVDRTNQKKSIDAQVHNQDELFNAQLAANELMGYALPDRASTVESIFHNLDRDVYNAGVVKDTKEISQAQEVIRHPDNYSSEQQSWAKGVVSSSGMPIKRSGGKLKKVKTKFSINL
jgi:hypothetical protein